MNGLVIASARVFGRCDIAERPGRFALFSSVIPVRPTTTSAVRSAPAISGEEMGRMKIPGSLDLPKLYPAGLPDKNVATQ